MKNTIDKIFIIIICVLINSLLIYNLCLGSEYSDFRKQNLHWKTFSCDSKGCCNTRQYLLLTKGNSVNRFNNCKITLGVWKSFYTNTIITSSTKGEIDHILPYRWIYENGGKLLSTEKQLEIYNDVENLAIATVKENIKKSDNIKIPFKISKEKEKEVKEIQCYICSKHNLQNCNTLCE